MAKKFEELKKKMSPQRRAAAEAQADKLLAEAMAIDAMRRSLRLTQEQIAAALKVKQGAVSQMERQDDMYISTLRRLIQAMGGSSNWWPNFPTAIR